MPDTGYPSSAELAPANEMIGGHKPTEEYDSPAPIPPDAMKDPTLTPLQQKLFEENLPRVQGIARAVLGEWGIASPDELEEAILDGNLGLVRAIKVNFDTAKAGTDATTHSTYIRKSVMGEIKRGMRQRYGRVYTRIKNEEGKVIEVKDMTARVKPSVMTAINTADSFDRQTGEGNGRTLGDFTPGPFGEDEIINQVIAKVELEHILMELGPRDKEIFVRRTVLGQTQTEIAQAVGVSQMQISRILKRIWPK